MHIGINMYRKLIPMGYKMYRIIYKNRQ